MYEYTSLSVVEPAAPYTPPPPPPPPKMPATVSLSRCRLCAALVSFETEGTHRDWHLVNGLHGATCALLRSMTAQRGTDTLLNLDACDCGLETDKKES